MEIKTSRNGASIDCHYPHVGLHLLVSFITTGEKVVVDDVLAAFLRYEDYRITVPKTQATTLKASFSRAICLASSRQCASTVTISGVTPAFYNATYRYLAEIGIPDVT